MKIGLLCGAMSVAGAGSAWAGHAQERQGFWFGAGAGYGSANATCDTCEGDRESGVTGYLKLGGTLNERVLLGGEFNLWTKEVDGASLNLYNASATVTFYPPASSGFFVKGGAGLSFVDTEFREGSTTTTVDLGQGLGLLAGAGYDVRLGKNFSITPAVNYYWGRPGDLKIGDDTVVTKWKQNVVDFTIGVTFH